MENDKKKENVFVKAVKAVKSVLKKAWAAVRRFFYDVSVAVYHKTHKKPRKIRSYSARRRSEILFLVCLLAYPILIFFVGYVYVNINSVLLTFQTYDIDKGVFYWSGLTNIKKSAVGSNQRSRDIAHVRTFAFFLCHKNVNRISA